MNTQTPAAELTPESADSAPQLLLHLEPVDARRLANLSGQYDCHLKQIQQRLSISIHNRGNAFVLEGDADRLYIAAQVLEQLYADTAGDTLIAPDDVHLALQEHGAEAPMAAEPAQPPEVYSAIRTKRAMSKPVAPTNNPTWPPYAPTISILVSALLAPAKPTWPWPARLNPC